MAVLSMIGAHQNLRTENARSAPDWMRFLTIGNGVAAFGFLTLCLVCLPAGVPYRSVSAVRQSKKVTWFAAASVGPLALHRVCG